MSNKRFMYIHAEIFQFFSIKTNVYLTIFKYCLHYTEIDF